MISDPAKLAYFVERGRRSYDKDVSFAKWSERMIIAHGNDVIPYLREAWKCVRKGTIPIIAADIAQKNVIHTNGNGSNGHAKNQLKRKTFPPKLDWKTFTVGIIVGLVLCLGLFFALTSHWKQVPTSAAKNYIGKSITVVGMVSEIHVTPKGTVLLDMDGHFPNEQFTAVWLAPGAPVAQLQNFDGKTISVKGIIQEYRGRPEIILTSLSQISD